MTKRKHAEMIKAWAVVREGDADWRICALPIWDSFAEYFLCLPQHNENGQCLRWLNGGEVENLVGSGWHDLAPKIMYWSRVSMWMSNCTIRIKPKKEKRWIVVNTATGNTTPMFHNKCVAESKLGGAHSEFQLIEIEVEV